MNVTRKLIESHLVEGEMQPGAEIALEVDQCLLQDATGTLVMLELEAMELDRVKVELACQYVDHNLVQEDHRNADDHLFLYSACRRFGLHFSRPGNGVSHPVHMQHFGVPGKTMAGADSHTCAAGGLGMLALGCGGVEVAMALAGEPLHLTMPEVWGVELVGELPEWVSAKDVILEMLRRHGVDGGLGRVVEYWGPGVSTLSAWDRHVIANMGAELGATTTVFPSDGRTREFLEEWGREEDWTELGADGDPVYDVSERIDLGELEPLIARPQSPGNVVPVREVTGEAVYQAYIGSSANPGFRDFAVAASMVRGSSVDPRVSFDVNPASRQLLEDLASAGLLSELVRAGARIHQAGCNGCIGMGQAPATGRNSLRTVPRNFPGRSGTKEDSVFLCSPETATAAALRGEITDPRYLGIQYPSPVERAPSTRPGGNGRLIVPPLPPDLARDVELVKGPNIKPLPELEELPEDLSLQVLLCLGNDISTDEILPAGTRVLPYRSNLPKIAGFCFEGVDASYHDRAIELRDGGDGHAVVAGRNYGQGSSREHAALAPRSLGLRLVLARSFARIHWQNLVNFGVLPLRFDPDADADVPGVDVGDRLILPGVREALASGHEVVLRHESSGREIPVRHDLSPRQVEVVLAGGVINRRRRG